MVRRAPLADPTIFRSELSCAMVRPSYEASCSPSLFSVGHSGLGVHESETRTW